MSTEQEIAGKIAQIDSNSNQELRIKGYLELITNVLDSKKFNLFKVIVDHCKRTNGYNNILKC